MEKRLIPNSIMLAEVSEMLSEGRGVVILTRGYSMLPFIIGDRDSVRLVRRDTYSVGDIVLAQIVPGRWVLHRLFRVEGESVTLKGDGNLYGTEQCRLSDIAGCVDRIIRRSGRETSCDGRCFGFRSRLWRSLPAFFRRCYLAFYRRLKRIR